MDVAGRRRLNGNSSWFGSNLVAHRVECAEIGKDSGRVLASDLRIGRIRHCRIQANTVFANALMKRPPEVLFGPAADPGRNIGSYVRAQQRSERRLQRSAAGKRFTSRRGVAADAITRYGEVPAALDLFERLVVFRRPRGNCADRAGRSRQNSSACALSCDTSPVAGCQAWTSGPGLFRYWFTIASVAQ